MTKVEAIEFFVNKETLSSEENEAVKMAIVALAQPEPKKGKWIHINRLEAEYDECSCCRAHEKHGSPWYSYCPYCGAQLERAEC